MALPQATEFSANLPTALREDSPAFRTAWLGLSEAPEARGTAAQAAEALESAAVGEERPERSKPPVRARVWPWLALGATGACTVLWWHSQAVGPSPGPMTGNTPRASASRTPDADTAAMGDTAPTAPRAPTAPATEQKPLAQEPLPEPRPGQIRPDSLRTRRPRSLSPPRARWKSAERTLLNEQFRTVGHRSRAPRLGAGPPVSGRVRPRRPSRSPTASSGPRIEGLPVTLAPSLSGCRPGGLTPSTAGTAPATGV
jgi:hypothetical protein